MIKRSLIKWTEAEYQKLRDLVASGKDDKEISFILGRTLGGTQAKRCELGLRLHTHLGRPPGKGTPRKMKG